MLRPSLRRAGDCHPKACAVVASVFVMPIVVFGDGATWFVVQNLNYVRS